MSSRQIPAVNVCADCAEKRLTVTATDGSEVCSVCLADRPPEDRPKGYESI